MKSIKTTAKYLKFYFYLFVYRVFKISMFKSSDFENTNQMSEPKILITKVTKLQ